MKNAKRIFTLALCVVIAVLSLSACGSSTANKDSSNVTSDAPKADTSPIKVGVLEDASGEFALVGIQKRHAVELAVSEINAAGGLLGRQLEVVAPDTQSNNQRFQEMAKKLILQDKVDVIMGCYTSASREAIRPIIEQNKMLLFYNNQYEGGVASRYVFATGAVPEHQITTLMEAMIQKYGKKIYTIAADYNFGQISADWVKKSTEENGGEIVGEEFIPLTVSQFSSTISKIQQAKPDVLVTLLVGDAQSSFYEQWAKAGIAGLPMATTVNMAQGYEHKRFAPPALANMYVTATYMEEVDTPESNDFKSRWKAKFPDEPYIGMEAEAEYTGVYLWAEAVKAAGTVEKEKVIDTLETGISYEGPAGKVIIDGATHHAIRDVYLAYADEKHNITFPTKWEAIVPDWLSKDLKIDITKEAPNKQFTPLD